MSNLALEIARSGVIAATLGVLILHHRKCHHQDSRGWDLMVAGFGLLLFGSLLDVADNFEAFDRYVLTGETEVKAVLENLVGYLMGFVLVFLGFWQWWRAPVSQDQPRASGAGKDSFWPLAAVLFVGIAVSVVAFYVADRVQDERTERDIQDLVNHQGAMLGRNVERHLEAIHSIASLYATSGGIERGEFRTFVQRSLTRNPGIRALEWIPRVPAAERAAYEAAARQSGLAGFRIRERTAEGDMIPAGAREEYYPVYFVEPIEGNEAALGYDLASNAARLRTLELARDTGRTVATPRIRLVQETGDQYGFLTFMPIYRNGVMPDTVEARRTQLAGFALGVFSIGDMLGAGLRKVAAAERFDIYLIDESGVPGERLLHYSPSALRDGPADPISEQGLSGQASYAASHEFAGRHWKILLRPVSLGIFDHESPLPWGLGALGILLTAWLVQIQTSARDRTREVERQVAERSRELVAANEALEKEISERKRVSEQLSQAQKMEAIGQLTGGIAHDFNNLLMVIDGYARRAASAQGGDEAGKSALTEVLRATEKATNLTRQLLVFSRRQVMEKRVIRIADALSEITGLLERSVGEQYEIQFKVEDEEVCVETDSGELSQSLVNLVINARDAMPEGGPIVVGLRTVDLDEAFVERHPGLKPGRFAELYVEDHGDGIDAETLGHVFEPFFTTKEQGKGTGLGLAMVYGFVQQSRGTVDISSTCGAGTTVRVYLPVVDRPPHAVAAAEVEEAHTGKGETLLLVEDDDALLELTRGLLGALGYKVLTAADGLEALEVDEDHEGSIDLLLSDVVMPSMGGFELSEILQETRPDMRIVFMSGYPNRGQGNKKQAPSPAQFLQKPIKPSRLAQAIRKELDEALMRLGG